MIYMIDTVFKMADNGRFVVLILVIFPLLSLCEYISIPLNGKWKIHDNHGKYNIDGIVPGNVHTALMKAKILDNPYNGFNDDIYSWVADWDWIYEREVNVHADLLKKAHVLLLCEGLDTVGMIEVNNKHVAQFNNMFISYKFDIKSFLKVGTNQIRITFKSPTTYAASRYNNLTYPVPPVSRPASEHGRSHVNMIRKEQASFGWDWGPSFPTVGIWRSISLLGMNAGVIDTVTVETVPGKAAGSWTVRLDVFLTLVPNKSIIGILECRLQISSMIDVKRNVKLSSKNPRLTVDIPVSAAKKIKAWWPNGHGAQTLYQLDVTFTVPIAIEISTRRINLGFRSIQLVQETLGKGTPGQGLSFYFKINDKPIYLKGANWIPVDSFQDRITPDKIKHLLQSAVDANMNAMRIWGGGIYEQDLVYDLADQLGILIWQDMMFACALYPSDAQFLNNVHEEVIQQIRRLKRHPSILIWAGNNENEAALAEDWYGVKAQFARYKADYVKLYVDTIRPIIKREDTSRPFVTSSPSDGDWTEKHGWVAKDPQLQQFGDVHYYNHTTDLWNVSVYPVPRMATEYGVLSWCSFNELEPVSNSADWSFTSKWSTHRQHAVFGNMQLMAAINRHFPYPASNDTLRDFKNILYLTQVIQAESLRTETEHYRRHQSGLVNGFGDTMGAMYWQLNDIWQAPSLSSIEFSGRWKMLHYFARKFFAASLISPFIDGGVLKVYVIMESYAVDVSDKMSAHRTNPVLEQNVFGMDTNTVMGRFQNEYARDLDSRSDTKVSVDDYMNDYLRAGALMNGERGRETAEMERKLEGGVTRERNGGTLVLNVGVYSWKNMTPLHTWKQSFTMKAVSQQVYTTPISTLMKIAKCKVRDECFLHFSVTSKEKFDTTWLPLTTFKNCTKYMAPAHIKIASVTKSGSSYSIKLTSDAIAVFVWLNSDPIRGKFSQNGFLMLTNDLTVTFDPWQTTTAAKLKSAVTVMSLMDVY